MQVHKAGGQMRTVLNNQKGSRGTKGDKKEVTPQTQAPQRFQGKGDKGDNRGTLRKCPGCDGGQGDTLPMGVSPVPSRHHGSIENHRPEGIQTMRAIPCQIEYIEVENDSGRMVEGVRATCPRCGDFSESFGNSDASVRRCLVLLREGCANGERNFYSIGDE